MVTQNGNFLEAHLALPSEPPPIIEAMVNHNQAQLLPEKKILNREDPMSHRIIEKRRRDRMNNCLADLSRLIPADYLKKGRGRIEKTEIIEMAIKHMKYLHSIVCSRTNGSPNLELPIENNGNTHPIDNFEQDKGRIKEDEQSKTPESSTDQSKVDSDSNSSAPINLEHFKLGYKECLSESMHYLVEVKGYYPGSSLCMQLICHLQKHCDKILKGDRLNKPRTGDSTSTNSPGSNRPHGPGSSSSDSCERLQMPKQEPIDIMYDSNNINVTPRDSYDTNNMTRDNYDTNHMTRDNFETNNMTRDNYDTNNMTRDNYDTNNMTRDNFDRVSSHHSHQRLQYDINSNQNSPFDGNNQQRENGDSNMGIQIRDNLTTPNLAVFNFEQDCQGSVNRMNSTLRQHESYPHETSPSLSTTDTNSLYKFKNNIKQRFTAEHSLHHNGSSSGYTSIPPTGYTVPPSGYNSLPPNKKSKLNNEHLNNIKYYNESSEYDNQSVDIVNKTNRNKSVAIFMLHSDGTFYIPLTIDSTALIPYLIESNIKKTYRNSPLVLHPVTISVCFQHRNSNSSNNQNQNVHLKRTSSTIEN